MVETPDATQQDQTTHGALLRAEDTWPLTDEHPTIPYLDQQELGAQLWGLGRENGDGNGGIGLDVLLVSPAYVERLRGEQRRRYRQHNVIKVVQRHQMPHDQTHIADCCLGRRPGH
jgi:hypothetical protein